MDDMEQFHLLFIRELVFEMGRQRRRFIRESGNKSARLIIIATEGSETEPKYFESVRRKFRSKRTHIEIISTEKSTTKSAPEYVMDRLNSFKKEYILNTEDELWIIIDFDRWGVKKLSEINKLCYQKKYFLAVSNPCFEIWILLHFKSLTNISKEEKNRIKSNAKISRNRRYFDKLIFDEVQEENILYSYIDSLAPYVQRAIKNAKELDKNSSEDWPNDIGSHVYKCIENIISK